MFVHHELLNDKPSAFISVSLSAVLEEAKTGGTKYVDPEGFPSSQLDADQVPYGHSVVSNLHAWQPTPKDLQLLLQNGGSVTNRKLRDIVKDQKPLVLAESATVQEACRFMWERRTGSVLVVDNQQHLIGIFTARDTVRTLAEGNNAEVTTLTCAMTRDPITIKPDRRAIDALPESQRIVITLRDVTGLDAEEVCEALGITHVNQRVLLHRARARGPHGRDGVLEDQLLLVVGLEHHRVLVELRHALVPQHFLVDVEMARVPPRVAVEDDAGGIRENWA